jgi:lipopolysaccharide export system protein LptA
MKLSLKFIVFVLALIGNYNLAAQVVSIEKDTSKAEKVIIKHSDKIKGTLKNGIETRYLEGNVQIRQGPTFMSCDTAVLFVSENNLTAEGNVIIQQGDTLTIFADSLSYLGDEEIAELFGNVSLLNKDKELYTDRLIYNLKTKVASYFTGATLVNDSTQLTSRRGYYYVETNDAYFKDTVNVVDPEFSLNCDTLQYNTTTNIATFHGPTRIIQNESKIYCESGFYNTSTRDAKLYNNTQFIKGDQQATADTIIYDGTLKEVILNKNARFTEKDKNATADRMRYVETTEITFMEGNAVYNSKDQNIVSDTIVYDSKKNKYKTISRSIIIDGSQILKADVVDFDDVKGVGHAEGNVIWVDTAEHLTIICDEVDYIKETDYILAKGERPMLISMVDNDSLWLTSDTLVSFREHPEDSLRTVLAYNDVRIFKSDLQAICDSLSYSTGDSLFNFYNNPIIWSDTSQFSADTVHIQMANNKIDRIFLVDKSFIINSPDELFFNQIKGKLVTAFFEENDIRRMKVVGNAETVYYLMDEEDAYVGVNKSICSEMMIYFGNNQIDDIRYYDTPNGELTPMKKANHDLFLLEGFKWETKRRPMALEDLLKKDF